MPDYFYHTGIKSNCFDALYSYSQVDDWQYDKVSHIHAKVVSPAILDDYLLELQRTFNGVALLMKLPARSFYAWHTDRRRLCCLNLELNHTNSITYYGTRADRDLPGRDIYDNLTRLDYQDQYVLLNTREYHCVANSGEPRLLFTLGFNHTAYEEVKRYLKDK